MLARIIDAIPVVLAGLLTGVVVATIATSADGRSARRFEADDRPRLGAATRSAGCGRPPPCNADAGTPADATVVCPSQTITVAGAPFEFQIEQPASYTGNVPLDHWLKRCGCTFGMAACVGTLRGLSSGANTIVSTPNPAFQSPTDCSPSNTFSCRRSVPTDDANNDDLERTQALINWVEDNYCVSRNLYAGESNGSMCGHWVTSNLPGSEMQCLLATLSYQAPPGQEAEIATMYLPTTAQQTPVFIAANADDTIVPVGLARSTCQYWRGVNDGTRDAGSCLGVDGGGPSGCAPGAVQTGFAIDGGSACSGSGGFCCTFAESGGPVRYCECATGGHNTSVPTIPLGREFCEANGQGFNR